MFDENPTDPVTPPARDGVAGLDTDDPPAVVSVSDIHGHLDAARNALLALADNPVYEPLVMVDSEDRLHWAGGDEYVLVFNGDLFDRGPDNQGVATMVSRLARQAPDGHVRVTLGNHEMAILTPDFFGWDGWFSVERSDDERRAFLDRVREGLVVAAYEGYGVTYAHAGRPDPYEASPLNDDLVAIADHIDRGLGTADDADVQRQVVEEYPEILGVSGQTGRGPGAGIAWLDFTHMPADAPPQVVGHTRQYEPRRKGAVVCENTIRNNKRREGGETVVVETPDRLVALVRTNGGVQTREFSLPERAGAGAGGASNVE